MTLPQRYSFFLGDGPSVKAVEDEIGNWVKVESVRDVFEELRKLRRLLKAAKQCRSGINHYNELTPLRDVLDELE